MVTGLTCLRVRALAGAAIALGNALGARLRPLPALGLTRPPLVPLAVDGAGIAKIAPTVDALLASVHLPVLAGRRHTLGNTGGRNTVGGGDFTTQKASKPHEIIPHETA